MWGVLRYLQMAPSASLVNFLGAVFLLCSSFISPVARAETLRWQKLYDIENTTTAGGEPDDLLLPSTRKGACMAFDDLNNSLVVFGGVSQSENRSGFRNSLWRFDLDANAWSVLASHDNGDGAGAGGGSSAPTPRAFLFCGIVRVAGESVFVLSHGFGAGNAEYDDVWAFRLGEGSSTGGWTMVEASGSHRPGKRYGGHGGTAFGETDSFWVGAGFTLSTSLATRYIDTYKLVFDDSTSPTSADLQANWVRVWGQPSIGNQFHPLRPHGRCLQGSAVLGDAALVMMGGCMRRGTGGGPCPTDDSWYLDFNSSSWTRLPYCATPRVWGAMATISGQDRKAVLYGGTKDNTDQVILAEEWPEHEVLIADAIADEWKRYRADPDPVLQVYPARRFAHTMAPGRDGVVYMFGGEANNGSGFLRDLWLLKGASDPDVEQETGCSSPWFAYTHLHGLLMGVAFGILFPTGFLIARFYRCSKSKAWFIAHVCIQLTAVLFTFPAFIMIFLVGASQEPSHPHAIVGIFLEALVVVQPFIGFFRPHIKEGKKRSAYRIFWEWFHRTWGLFIISLGFVQVTLGVFLVVPPMPVWVVWLCLMGLWLISFAVHQLAQCVVRCISRDGSDDDDFEHEMK